MRANGEEAQMQASEASESEEESLGRGCGAQAEFVGIAKPSCQPHGAHLIAQASTSQIPAPAGTPHETS
jgi:hypothetical protein